MYPRLLCCRLIGHGASLLLCFLFSFIDLCVCYCDRTMCFLFLWVCRLSEVWEDDTSNFILFPQDCFGNLESFYSSIWILGFSFLCCCRLVAKSRPALCDPMDWSMPGFPILHCLLEFSQTHVLLVSPPSHLILCHPLLLLPSIFPSIKVLSNETSRLRKKPISNRL